MKQPKILIYTSIICPYCTMAKHLLNQKGAHFDEVNLDKDPELRNEIMTQTKKRTVPQIFIGQQHIGGFDDLYRLEVNNKLDNLLNPS
ncbi:MAG: glutaredoxin 3 [Methylococcales bacterium]|nr:glutaredoxin 3 [Methylococcales bacterium]